jgi:glycosyltransferase involved in cell wall biosynthesis
MATTPAAASLGRNATGWGVKTVEEFLIFGRHPSTRERGGAVSERPILSIVIPVYNEEESVQPLYQSNRQACDPLGKPYEIIFVDDGSEDGTYGILAQIHRRDARVKVIRFRKNFGQTAAMTAGFAYAKGEVIISMDGDLQNDPADIPKLLAKLEEGFDVVCGWRKRRQDKFWSRRLPSMAANWLIGRITGVHIHDNGCSLKAYHATVIKNVALYGELHRFIPAMSTLTGARIAEIPVNHHPRRFGTSKYSIGRVWRVALDIVTVKMLTGFASRPALWFGLLSLPWAVLGGAVLAVAGAMYAYGAIEEWTVMSTVAFLLLFMGGNLLAMGLMGELFVRSGEYCSKHSPLPKVKTLEVE